MCESVRARTSYVWGTEAQRRKELLQDRGFSRLMGAAVGVASAPGSEITIALPLCPSLPDSRPVPTPTWQLSGEGTEWSERGGSKREQASPRPCICVCSRACVMIMYRRTDVPEPVLLMWNFPRERVEVKGDQDFNNLVSNSVMGKSASDR